MAEIYVRMEREEPGGPLFHVRIEEGGSATEHEVSLSREDLDRLRIDDEGAEAFVERCFRFLLDREPKESILARFDVRDIGRYFPDFERTISRRSDR